MLSQYQIDNKVSGLGKASKSVMGLYANENSSMKDGIVKNGTF